MEAISRRALLLSSLAVPVAGMAGRAFAGSGEITITHYFTGDLGLKAFNGELAKFTKATGIKVVDSPIGHEDFKTNILVRAAGHALPDVFSYWAGARVQFIVDSGALHPIDAAWDKAGLNDIIAKPIAEAATMYDGKRYLVPFDYHYVGMFYNVKVMKKIGMTTPPKTWDDFLALCKKLKAAGIDPVACGSKNRWPAQFWFDYILLRTAGPEYRAKLVSGKASYTDPEVEKAFEMWQSLLDAGFFAHNSNANDWTDAADKVTRGEAAMTLMGTWVTGYWNGVGQKPGEDYDFFEFPEITKGVPNVALGPVDGLVMAENAKNVPGSEEFLTYMVSNPEVQSSWAKAQGALSANTKVDPASYNVVMRKASAAVAQADGFAFNYDLATPPPVAEVGLSMFAHFLDSPKKAKQLLAQAEQDAKTAFAKK